MLTGRGDRPPSAAAAVATLALLMRPPDEDDMDDGTASAPSVGSDRVGSRSGPA